MVVIHSGNGGWSSLGVSTVIVNDTFVNCNTTHLTSFAVLVDVSGTQIVMKYIVKFVQLPLCTFYPEWS